MTLFAFDHVSKSFAVKGGGIVRAVDDVSVAVEKGRTVALVGESGCGKTTLARLALRLEQPGSGMVQFDGADIHALSGSPLKEFRRRMQAVFQDPYASLNPRLRIRTIIAEPILAHTRPTVAALRARVAELLDIVGLPSSSANLYPHEFSGGQRQRIAIARALALQPEMIVLDEPISALDVSIRAQILNLLMDIQERFGLTYLVIAHDLALVEHMSDTVAVVYLGTVLEQGPTRAVFASPAHPYTQRLLAAVARPDPDFVPPAVTGFDEVGSALEPPAGCKFHQRCPHVMPVCRSTRPPDIATGDGRVAACFLLDRALAPAGRAQGGSVPMRDDALT